uniref:Uncharacterized protein n=1 Tax=Biomphalaria glabrata TaxID=6526 RepID=A0A2C9M4B7_BIOGL
MAEAPVCTTLYEVCCVVSSLDIKLVISLLRGISRLSSQHLSLLQDRLDVSPIIKYLCHEIGQGYEYLFELCGGTQTESLSQGDDKTFDKLVKVLGFQMKVMVALLRDYSKYLDNCEKNITATKSIIMPCRCARHRNSWRDSPTTDAWRKLVGVPYPRRDHR